MVSLLKNALHPHRDLPRHTARATRDNGMTTPNSRLSKGTPIALAALGVIAFVMTAKEHQAAPGVATTSAPPALVQPAVAASAERVSPALQLTPTALSDAPAAHSPEIVQVALAKMSPTVVAHANAGGAEPVPVIVRYADAPELFENERLRRLGGEVVRRFDRLGLLAVKMPAGALVDLAIADSVRRISLDAPVQSTATFCLSPTPTNMLSAYSAPKSNLDHLRSLMPEHLQTVLAPVPGTPNAYFGGQGIGVAIVDSGVERHDDLRHRVVQYDFVSRNHDDDDDDDYGRQTWPDDDYGHGTLVAGILGGNGQGSSNGKYAGIARSVNIISLRVLDDHGQGLTSDAIAAMDWLVDNRQQHNIKVANLSIGKAVEESVEFDPLVLAVEAAWDAGIAVVVAAGNHGRDGNFTITSPGNSPKVITVGSLTDNGTADVSDDYVSTFSSRGPTLIDHYLKPDLVAPGNKIVSTVANRSELKSLLSGNLKACDTAYCDDDYLEMSGTSMAAPIVAATVALMYEKHGSTMTPDAAKARLMRTARKIDIDATATGAGVLNIDGALNGFGAPANAALSPKMARATNANAVAIQNTAVLWGGAEWSNANVWADGYLWSDEGTGAQGFLWSDETTAQGFLWSDETGAYGFLWSDETGAHGFLWSDEGIGTNGYLWSQGYLWSDVVTNVNPLIDLTSSIVLKDD